MTSQQKQLKAALLILETIEINSLDFVGGCNLQEAIKNLKEIIEPSPEKPSIYTPEKRQEIIHKYDLLIADMCIEAAAK